MYDKPTEDDFIAALNERGEQIGLSFGKSLDSIMARMAAAGRLRSGASVKMMINAARECLDEGTNKLLTDLKDFTEGSDLDPAKLRDITGKHLDILTNVILSVTQQHIAHLEVGDAAQAQVEEMKADLSIFARRRFRQFEIGMWRRGGDAVAMTSNTINAENIIGGVQQGSHGSHQHIAQTVQLEAIPKAVADLETALAECPSGKVVEDLRADIATITSQVAKSEPSRGVLAEAGKSVRSIVEGITAGALTPSAVAAAMTLAHLLGAS